MRTSDRPTPPRGSLPAPWPTIVQLERMGLVRCEGDPDCTTWVDPVNVPARRCKRHHHPVKPAQARRTG